MIVNSVDHFQSVCKKKLSEWYKQAYHKDLDADNIFVVWCCKTLQNYKAIMSTTLRDGIFVEFTYNGDKKELYRDVYTKLSNDAITEE